MVQKESIILVFKQLKCLQDREPNRHGNYYGNYCNFSYTEDRIHFSSMVSEMSIQIRGSWITFFSDKFGVSKVPYDCEDENEFFQLGTMYDYWGMTYAEFNVFKDLFNYMKYKSINEKNLKRSSST